MSNDRLVNVRLTPDDIKAATIMAKQDNMDRSKFIRELVRKEAAKRGLLSPQVWLFEDEDEEESEGKMLGRGPP